jgi:5,6-dimethylbenzimidazole synthase
MSAPPVFDAEFRARLHDLLVWRRDVRRFRRDPLPQGAIEQLIEAAALAPSVGLSQPSRFVIVAGAERRRAVRRNFETSNAAALAEHEGERAALYARLKLAGLDEAPGHLAVFADRSTAQGHGLGRRTMPETIEYSTVAAIHTMWLVARAEGIGLGWVSILDPAPIATTLDVPETWLFVAYLCIGFPAREDDVPTLARNGWEARRPGADSIIYR